MKRAHNYWQLALVLVGMLVMAATVGALEATRPVAADTATAVSIAAGGVADSGSDTAVDADDAVVVPVVDLSAHNFAPVGMPEARPADTAGLETAVTGTTSTFPGGEIPPVTQTAVDTAAPGQVVPYAITLTNSGAVTEAVALTVPLPPQLALVEAGGTLTYNHRSHSLFWQGNVPPGRLDYHAGLLPESLPLIDLAVYGQPHLCPADCNDAVVTFNLGAAGYSATLYGARHYQLRVAADGLIFTGATPPSGPRRLPDTAVANAGSGTVLAGLWQDLDLTAGGRWHAAILSGYLTGHDVFYAQWQAAPQAANPDVVSSFAIAVVVEQVQPDGPGSQEISSQSGRLFFIYGPISQPDALTADGYAIGMQAGDGLRGSSYAYAGPSGALGSPPAATTTLMWTPHLYGADFQRHFHYRVRVAGAVPSLIAATAETTWAGDRRAWATHYLAVRHLTYLPVITMPAGNR